MNSIVIHGLSKSYGKVKALRPVEFNVNPGELFGLIGPDGAGKTTLFRMLTTLIMPDAGTATVDGLDLHRDYRAIRSRVGYMPGRFSLYPDLTVAENVAFFAALFGVDANENRDLIAPIYNQIAPFASRRAGKLSGGMKQKLALCCAMIHRPSVLFLDEPTTGVDAVSRSEFWDMLAELKDNGITILVSTPYMDEASRCDRIALINEGKILGIDTPAGLVGSYNGTVYAITSRDKYSLLLKARRLPGVKDVYPFGVAHHLIPAPGFDVQKSMELLRAEGFEDVDIAPVTPDVEDVFIKLMKNE